MNKITCMARIFSTTSSCLQASIKAYSLYTVRTYTPVISKFITIVICFYVFQLKLRIFLQYIIIYLPALFFHKCFTTRLISHFFECNSCFSFSPLQCSFGNRWQIYCPKERINCGVSNATEKYSYKMI